MKRGAPDHPKVAALAALLNIEHFSAVGILELVWHFTAKFSPQGDIGKHSDAAIAEAVRWRVRSGSHGVPTGVRLTSALVEAGLVDRCTCHRLVVHHWFDHADEAVRKYLSRQGLDFVRHLSSLPLPIPMPMPEPEPLPPNPVTRPLPPKEPQAQNPADQILATSRDLYQQAGVPIAPKHEQLAIQLILAIPDERRPRLPAYIRHCLESGRWSDSSTTKGILNVLRDGDWDVEITPRTIPKRGKSREDEQRAEILRLLEEDEKRVRPHRSNASD